MENKYFILMADIINSSNVKGQLLMKNFKSVVSEINNKYKAHIISPLTITLGDEFQALIKNELSAILIIQAIEESIIIESRNFKLRYVVNYGEIDTPINKKIAYGMLGPGLTLARQQIEDLKNKKGERVYFDIGDQLSNKKLNNLFFIYTSLVDDWKKKDLKSISLFLIHKDYKIVADFLQKDRSLLWRKHKSLRLMEYWRIKELLEIIH